MGVHPQVSGAAVEKHVSPGMSAELGQLFLWWEINPVGWFLVRGRGKRLLRLDQTPFFFSRQNPTPLLPASEGPVHSLFSPVRLFATPWTVAHQAPLSMGILQARILEWVAMSSSRGSSQPRDRTRDSCVSCINKRVLYR